MHRSVTVVLWTGLLVGVAVGCSDGDQGGGSGAEAQVAGDDAPTSDPAPTADPASDVGGLEGDGREGAAAVVIEGFTYDPGSMEVAAGSTVVWSNQDGVAHTVTAGGPGEDPGPFDESVAAGGTVEVTFEEGGSFPYYCRIHPAMAGEVLVS